MMNKIMEKRKNNVIDKHPQQTLSFGTNKFTLDTDLKLNLHDY